MTVGALVVDVLAQNQEPAGPEFGKASPLGLALVIVLLVATALLIWSMNKQLRKLPETFQPEHPEPDQAVDDGTLAAPKGAETTAAPKNAEAKSANGAPKSGETKPEQERPEPDAGN
ncbi:hypothetical protein OED52_05055 [Rhodococcus sp. Z13]|uniref:Uncharacterized protein n=1 Tax=Rhodococcus sacchari TaxID=2962047 RepID=A0ACD4DIR1_9NOCA|nr:hypothetical protein [Rhodococcus sp. Z13]UYP19926.1 hypothetical protein OED52_05055 [Rhodococcus sp. Z13]